MSSAVVSARTAGLDTMRSGFTRSFASRSPIRGASRLPRSFNGRSLSDSAGSSRLDLAWRTRKSVFIGHQRNAGIGKLLRPRGTIAPLILEWGATALGQQLPYERA